VAIGVACPRCHQPYSVEDNLAGHRACCEACKAKLIVPATAADAVTLLDADVPDADIPTLKSGTDHAQPPAVAPTLDADIQRGSVTITAFMAKHGIEGGVRLPSRCWPRLTHPLMPMMAGCLAISPIARRRSVAPGSVRCQGDAPDGCGSGTTSNSTPA